MLPKPLPHTLGVLTDPARFKVVVCGRRWGKTATGLQMVSLGHGPDLMRRGALFGGQIMWVAPTYKIVKSVIWPDLKRALQGVWLDKSEQDNEIMLPGGGMIRARSTDNPKSLLGVGLDGLVIDEASRIDQAVWQETLRPMLSDRGGWASFITTPNGRNWFHDLFSSAGDDHDWARWQRPTRDNPLITDEELESVKREIGLRAYMQEYEAQFVDVDGAEFSGEYFGESVWVDSFPPAEHQRLRVMALDPSKGKSDKADYSAFTMLTLCDDNKIYVDADLERRDARRIVDDGISIARRFEPHAFGVEINQFQEVLKDQLRDRAAQAGLLLPLHGIHNHENKRTRIRATLTPYLADDLLRFKRGSLGAKLLVDQLVAFPVADHDDGPDALEMGIRLMAHVLSAGTGTDDVTPERITA